MSSFKDDIFPDRRPLIGMVHLLPLPGSPRYGGDLADVDSRALADAAALADAGYDGVLVENYGDAPFKKGPVGPETCAAMTLLAYHMAATVDIPVGINVLRNDARTALAVAAAAGARFIRVNVHTGVVATDQGILEGRADETMRARARLRADVAVLADVLVKHGTPLDTTDPARAAHDAVDRGLADALIVSGEATGAEPDPARIQAVKAAVPDTPVLVGSGLTLENLATLATLADGAIVGTAVKQDRRTDKPVDPDLARRLLDAFREAADR